MPQKVTKIGSPYRVSGIELYLWDFPGVKG